MRRDVSGFTIYPASGVLNEEEESCEWASTIRPGRAGRQSSTRLESGRGADVVSARGRPAVHLPRPHRRELPARGGRVYAAHCGAVHPLRRRIQAFIERCLYRRKYDPGQTLSAFSAKLRDGTDPSALNDDSLVMIRETMQSTHASLWL